MADACLVKRFSEDNETVLFIEPCDVILGMENHILIADRIDTSGHQFTRNALAAKLLVDDKSADTGGHTQIFGICRVFSQNPAVANHATVRATPQVHRARVSIPDIEFFLRTLLLEKKHVCSKFGEIKDIVWGALGEGLDFPGLLHPKSLLSVSKPIRRNHELPSSTRRERVACPVGA